MDQINAMVDCDVARLNIALRPWFARAAHGFVAVLRRVPADVTGVYVRVFSGANTSVDVAAHALADGNWIVRCAGTAFPAAGEFRYEVHATAADSQPCAIGEGRVQVQAFGAPAANG